MGIWIRDMKRETNLPENVVTKAVKSLLAQKLIKEVVNIQSKGRKHYMAVEFEPSKELTGGTWYVEGNLDTAFISVLKDSCLKIIRKLKVATLEGVADFFKRNKITTGRMHNVANCRDTERFPSSHSPASCVDFFGDLSKAIPQPSVNLQGGLKDGTQGIIGS
ncbi:hypothetical protein F0562_022336 [Nyssa sinensis]|uniref:DNA-directed RNA polymerase III subunit RPC6 n=1 Tax=Nyssa sinensis TaxID=561372 RepID=A0A5J5BNU6_9ASTE|nr:hypothetical protein F0562_022336 [Nyssa sinensis]